MKNPVEFRDRAGAAAFACRTEYCSSSGVFDLGLPQAEGWFSAGDYIANFTGVLTFLWRYVALSNISARISHDEGFYS